MKTLRFDTVVAGLLALAAAATPFTAAATDYPLKPVKLMLPNPPGGTSDVIARIIQEPLAKLLGQQVLVDYKSGAGGSIGVDAVAKSAPDGYTLLLGNNGANVVFPLMQKVGYDPVASFAHISLIATTPQILVANGSVPVTDIKSTIAFARAQRGGITIGVTGGINTILSELFARGGQFESVKVNYKGVGPQLMAVLSGETQFMLNTSSDALIAHAKQGKVKLIAVTSEEPSPLFPGVPTLGSVIPGVMGEIWFGLFAPAGTPADVVEKLNAAMAAVIAQPDVKRRLIEAGLVGKASRPRELQDRVAGETAVWGKIVKDANIKLE